MKKIFYQPFLPKGSLIEQYAKDSDYSDSFSVLTSSIMTIDDRLTDTTKIPRWVNWLLKIRDFLVKPLGLSLSDDYKRQISNLYQVGDQGGFFTIIDRNDNEILMHENDKHLSFMTSVIVESVSDGQFVYMTTNVVFNKWYGRLYFFIIKPFHKLIFRSTLRRLS